MQFHYKTHFVWWTFLCRPSGEAENAEPRGDFAKRIPPHDATCGRAWAWERSASFFSGRCRLSQLHFSNHEVHFGTLQQQEIQVVVLFFRFQTCARDIHLSLCLPLSPFLLEIGVSGSNFFCSDVQVRLKGRRLFGHKLVLGARYEAWGAEDLEEIDLEGNSSNSSQAPSISNFFQIKMSKARRGGDILMPNPESLKLFTYGLLHLKSLSSWKALAFTSVTEI